MNQSPLLSTALVTFLFSAGLFGGAWAGNAASERMKGTYEELELFARIISIIEAEYVEEKPTNELIESAIRGIVDDLDPHSTWMSPEEYRALISDTEGAYEGIGVEVQTSRTGILITKVLDNSPAALAGLLPKDVITEIDETSTAGLVLPEVSKLLKGPRGTSVSVKVMRGTPVVSMTLSVTRDRVELPSVSSEGLAGGIGYFRITQFQKGTSTELAEAIRAQHESDFDKGIILDLRDNPGGLLEESIETADLFLRDGIIVTTRSRVDGETVYKAQKNGINFDTPIAVLINGMSASAAEIVASALQDRNRAHLIGTPTYGKGSVQTLYENSDESALKLTIGRYFTPSGQPVAPKEGRRPDEMVPMPQPESNKSTLKTVITTRSELDEQVRNEMLELLQPLAEEISPLSIDWEKPILQRIEADPQLRRAIDYLTASK